MNTSHPFAIAAKTATGIPFLRFSLAKPRSAAESATESEIPAKTATQPQFSRKNGNRPNGITAGFQPANLLTPRISAHRTPRHPPHTLIFVFRQKRQPSQPAMPPALRPSAPAPATRGRDSTLTISGKIGNCPSVPLASRWPLSRQNRQPRIHDSGKNGNAPPFLRGSSCPSCSPW